MAETQSYTNLVRDKRLALGWSQDELARRAGLSRAGVSAIETGRLVPSVAAALALAEVCGCGVKDLFRIRPEPTRLEPRWAWPPGKARSRFWQADVGGNLLIYPTEATTLGFVSHDGVFSDAQIQFTNSAETRRTLVMACCDPAVGLLAQELARSDNIRLIAFQRSSRQALALLGQGLVHVAGLHLSGAGDRDSNAAIVRQQLGTGYQLVRMACWEAGIAFAPGLTLPTQIQALRNHVRWVGRESGSGARACMDEVLEGICPATLMAGDHRGVAEAVRHQWADAGICLRLTSEEAGLDFKPVRHEAYDLCFHGRDETDDRIIALLRLLRDPKFRRSLGDLPGYDSHETGQTIAT